MSRTQAIELADKARPIFRNMDVYVCGANDGTFSVKVRDRCELILKFEHPDVNLEVYNW